MAQTDASHFFRSAYPALTGHPTFFPWQEELFLRLCGSPIPTDMCLPTGCGKTSVMALWCLALGWQARLGPHNISLPRRLVWVVNRRVVVDQATREAEALRKRLQDESLGTLAPLRHALRGLSAGNELIGISTLRGQFADNSEWWKQPARPAVIVGTIDMIGSRLLFSGYGTGFKYRPLHAGFLGQDALLVHDEAHLEPAFQHLVETVWNEQHSCREFRPLHVMALTATPRKQSGDVFGLTEADRRPGTEIQKRIEASKGIKLHGVGAEKEVAKKLLDCALEFRDSGRAILIFVQKVEDARYVAAILRKQLGDEDRVGELTGTIRGYERDRISQGDHDSAGVFARFMPDSPAAPLEGTVYLVCTSAGEVGVNMSGDHLACDLMPYDSMTQRFGRVNRFGEGEARIEIVYAEIGAAQKEFDLRRARTLTLLQQLPLRADGRYDASPAALEQLPAEERQAAFTPEPKILRASEILFDAWALTSFREKMPGRPPVGDWLHGVSEWQPAQTYVAWRGEVGVISNANDWAELEALYRPEDLLEDYPLKPHELLRDASHRVRDQLRGIAERKPQIRAWRVDPEAEVQPDTLGELLRDNPDDLRDCTILLPPEAGGLTQAGMLDGGAEYDGMARYDVADEWLDEAGLPRRWRSPTEDPPQKLKLRQVRELDLDPGRDEREEKEETSVPRFWRWYVREDGSRTARREEEWGEHTKKAERIAEDLVARLGLAEPERSAIVCAAKWHDLGKRRDLWQRSIGNHAYPNVVLAKSVPKARSIRYGDYRHELGSLADLSRLPEFLSFPPELQDLVLHLVAAHHGRARPHFPADEIFDPEFPAYVPELAAEVPRRFARLQRRYGRWGLAYLESLVRAADALASQKLDEAGAAGAEL